MEYKISVIWRSMHIFACYIKISKPVKKKSLHGQGALSTKCKSIPLFPSIYLIFFISSTNPSMPSLPFSHFYTPLPTLPHLLLGVVRPPLRESAKSTKILQNHQQVVEAERLQVKSQFEL